MVPGREIVALPDRAALAEQAAERFVSIARNAMAVREMFTVALSGGSTPRDLYALLATPKFSTQIQWTYTHVFFGDERAVPPHHPDSNYRMANEALISKIPIPQENVHRILGESKPDDAARVYEQILREFFAPTLSRVGVPRFDLILLGLGADGHTASLFPHTPALRETARWVIAYFVDETKKNRITLTAPVINAAENILFLVAGAEKVQAVRAVLRGDYRPDDFPAQLIQPTQGRVVWLLDREAASALGNKVRNQRKEHP